MPTAQAVFTPAAAAYLAGDVMDVAKAFVGLGSESGGEYIISSAELLISHTAVIAGETSYRLQLYSATPVSALADNAPWDLANGDRVMYLGYIDLGTPIDVGGTLYVQTSQINKQITIPSGGDLYAYLQTIGAFTATAAARTVKLHSVPM